MYPINFDLFFVSKPYFSNDPISYVMYYIRSKPCYYNDPISYVMHNIRSLVLKSGRPHLTYVIKRKLLDSPGNTGEYPEE